MKAPAQTATQDFRSFLQEELIRRCRANQTYSLRAYAKSLAISSSALSAILNGKRPLTEKSRIKLGAALGLTLAEIQRFKNGKNRGSGATEDLPPMSFDTFTVISEWYHFAILELVKVKSFKPDTAWAAKALNLSRSEVNMAVERLKRLGLLEVGGKGNWIDTSADGKLTNIHDSLTAASAKLMQRQILEKAIVALQETPLEIRSNTAMTFAIAESDLPAAKKRIQKFRREFADAFELRPADQVYHLAIALYPVTHINLKEKS